MEADWQETARVAFPPAEPQAPPTPCSFLVFDDRQELLWTGNDAGRITSFHGAELQRYTSYRGHLHEGPVKHILPVERGILSLSAKSVHLSIRRGLTVWHLAGIGFHNLSCICMLDPTSPRFLVAGRQSKMFIVNIDLGEVVETVDSIDHYTHMKRAGQYVCAATASGRVHILSTHDLSVQKEFFAHNRSIHDMDANKDFLITCGWSPRQHYGHVLDPMAKVFDLKHFRPMAPVVFHAGAAYVRMHPRMSTTAVIASQGGQMQLVDVTNPTAVNVRHVGLMEDNRILGLDFAPSGNALIFSDSLCTLQMWGHPSKLNFTDVSIPLESADYELSDQPIMDWSTNAPLNSIGMPYYREQLLSSWPNHLVFEVGSPPPKVEPTVLATLKAAAMGGHAPNPRTKHRNQAQSRRSGSSSSELTGPKFLSEQAKDLDALTRAPRRMSEMLKGLEIADGDSAAEADTPAIYRNVEIKYSKFGVDDFDFEFYNKTEYSGLETHIANSYINPLLQIMRFTTRIRNLALYHTASSCMRPDCILCEVGFLFDMLEKGRGQNCQATNFLKVFSSQKATRALDLLEEMSSTPPSRMIQQANRHLLEWMTKDYAIDHSNPDFTLYQTLSTITLNFLQCSNCYYKGEKRSDPEVHDLVYPNYPPMDGQPATVFSIVLKSSIERLTSKGWCPRCAKYQLNQMEKVIHEIPDVLTINTAINNAAINNPIQSRLARQLWSKPKWLPSEIGIIIDRAYVHCFEGSDLESLVARGRHTIRVYQLVGVVAEIKEGTQKSHLVAMANVSQTKRTSGDQPALPDEWHLFNDFLVRPISVEEALHFDASWKLPTVLTYQIKEYRHAVDDSWTRYLWRDLLLSTYEPYYKEDSASFRRLDLEKEQPGPNTEVGIDAEFVLLQQAEIEIKSDGTTSTLRPQRFGLGRVSVVRGEERSVLPRARRSSSQDSRTCDDNDDDRWTDAPQALEVPSADHGTTTASASEPKNVAFIDDYIAITPDRIVDHLTQFSGIKPGDLNPDCSPHIATGHLVHLKHAYKKIWILLNLGVIFVGHGLRKDFRTINIHVPKSQVVDTVELFYKKGARQLSLRFLIWLLLGEKVQTGEHGHDSIEDARAALRLWEKYKQLEREDKVEKTLKDIYRDGQKLGFRVPEVGEEGKISKDGRPVTPMDGAGASKPVTPQLTAATPQRKPATPRSGAITPQPDGPRLIDD